MSKLKFKPITRVKINEYLSKDQVPHAIKILKTTLLCLPTSCLGKIKEEYYYIAHALETAESILISKLSHCPVREQTVQRLKLLAQASFTIDEESASTYMDTYHTLVSNTLVKTFGSIDDHTLKKTTTSWINNIIKILPHKT
ncbi:MAG: hypothetical protein ACMV1B_03055 [Prevotella sp.]